MGKKCRGKFDEFLECCYHEREVELDKLRRDTRKHNEWWWLNIYDESGEIGKQAHWKPEEELSKMWYKNIIHNMIFKTKDSSMTEEQRIRR